MTVWGTNSLCSQNWGTKIWAWGTSWETRIILGYQNQFLGYHLNVLGVPESAWGTRIILKFYSPKVLGYQNQLGVPESFLSQSLGALKYAGNSVLASNYPKTPRKYT